ncbi:hypothetical protein NEIG_01266 [Nematocida sp. ERTm5]|nr:hypothetical protein NEIG_01266 [Nematocida sp. ERTm5]
MRVSRVSQDRCRIFYQLVFVILKLSMFLALCISNPLDINSYIKLANYSMEADEQTGHYKCTVPFGLEGRPVFGGQIFSHIIGCALKETAGYEVISGDCVFKNKTDPVLPIVYKSSVEPLGKTVMVINIDVIQEVEGKEEVRAIGHVLLQKKKSAIISEKKKYIKTIHKSQKNSLSEYFKPRLSDKERIQSMQPAIKYMKKILRDKEDFNKYVEIAHKRCSGVDVYISQHKTCKFARCIGYQLHMEKEETPPLSEEEHLSQVYTYLSFISDEYLLETALTSVGLCIINTKYNILTLSHSVNFNNCEKFNLKEPFFYTMWIDSIQNNMARCSGMIIQNKVVYANIKQIGKIIPLSKD